VGRVYGVGPEEDTNGAALVPVIAQDDRTGEVLMLAYMNDAARRKTEETGYATYYSRSRQTLWTKGETSGNLQRVCSLHIDCDRDTYLLQVEQTGSGSCHTGAVTCFAAHEDAVRTGPVLVRLERTIRDRLRHPQPASYTARLGAEGAARVAQKVVEEAGETAIAGALGDREALVREAADLLYHLWVLLAVADVSYAQVADELARRERPRPREGGGPEEGEVQAT